MNNIQTDKAIEIVSFGDAIKDVVNKKYPERSMNRDKIRTSFGYKDQKNIIHAALLNIMDAYNETDAVFLHGHSILVTHYGYLPGFPTILYKSIQSYYAEKSHNISLLVHLIANPEDILKRRKNDATRERDLETHKEIENRLNLSTLAMNSIAFNLYVPLLILDNSDGQYEIAIDNFLKGLVGRGVLDKNDLIEGVQNRLNL